MNFNSRILTVAAHDVIMAAVSFEASVALRYYTYGAPQELFFLWEGTLIFTIVCALTFWRVGLYRGIWYYASLNDLIAIFKAATLAILIFLPVMFLITRLEDFPRTAMVINWPLLIALLAGPRFLYRALKDGNLQAAFRRFETDQSRIAVLLAGAGDQADSFIREMTRSSLAAYQVVGIVDDKPGRVGRDIRGVRVLGALTEIDGVVARLDRDAVRPQRLIITSQSYDGEQVRGLLQSCERLGMILARLPRLTDFDSGDNVGSGLNTGGLRAFEPRPVDVEDVLGRPQNVLDRDAMHGLVAGRRVLVTGAGGTIGSELARQIADFGPAQLTLLDNAEYNLYRIDLEIGERHPQLHRRAVLADVRDSGGLRETLSRETPELLFHAAAFKHVPLVEDNPEEGVLTNAMGTRNVADACQRAGVAAMVLISTDKAVEPSSVMGATKRIAERYCQALSLQSEDGADSGTRFITVRFGNVLGSTGSVVPLFTRQIASGGPVTVTHEAVTRYFMTTREAVELVLQACALQDRGAESRGKIFVLDMGEPVRILDLAHQMIRLAGFRPEKDIYISITGLRRGEKLHEKLFADDETVGDTAHESIQLASSPAIDAGFLATQIDKLAEAARARRTGGIAEPSSPPWFRISVRRRWSGSPRRNIQPSRRNRVSPCLQYGRSVTGLTCSCYSEDAFFVISLTGKIRV